METGKHWDLPGQLWATKGGMAGLPAGLPQPSPVWAPRTIPSGPHPGSPVGTRVVSRAGPSWVPSRMVGRAAALYFSVG